MVYGLYPWCSCCNSVSVSVSDRDIPTRGEMDNAGNEVYLVSGIIRWPEGWDFSVGIGDP